jgi:hypothetical protein
LKGHLFGGRTAKIQDELYADFLKNKFSVKFSILGTENHYYGYHIYHKEEKIK